LIDCCLTCVNWLYKWNAFLFYNKGLFTKKDKIITYFVTKTFLILRLKVYIFYLKQSISTLLDSIRETLPFYSEKQNRYLCLFAHSGVQHIFCCVFVFLRLERYLYSDIVVPLVYYFILHYPVYNIQFKALKCCAHDTFLELSLSGTFICFCEQVNHKAQTVYIFILTNNTGTETYCTRRVWSY
jgi:hypothetical protein